MVLYVVVELSSMPNVVAFSVGIPSYPTLSVCCLSEALEFDKK